MHVSPFLYSKTCYEPANLLHAIVQPCRCILSHIFTSFPSDFLLLAAPLRPPVCHLLPASTDSVHLTNRPLLSVALCFAHKQVPITIHVSYVLGRQTATTRGGGAPRRPSWRPMAPCVACNNWPCRQSAFGGKRAHKTSSCHLQGCRSLWYPPVHHSVSRTLVPPAAWRASD
jgi:hypothetical protein